MSSPGEQFNCTHNNETRDSVYRPLHHHRSTFAHHEAASGP
jgi:hypothetical protein